MHHLILSLAAAKLYRSHEKGWPVLPMAKSLHSVSNQMVLGQKERKKKWLRLWSTKNSVQFHFPLRSMSPFNHVISDTLFFHHLPKETDDSSCGPIRIQHTHGDHVGAKREKGNVISALEDPNAHQFSKFNVHTMASRANGTRGENHPSLTKRNRQSMLLPEYHAQLSRGSCLGRKKRKQDESVAGGRPAEAGCNDCMSLLACIESQNFLFILPPVRERRRLSPQSPGPHAWTMAQWCKCHEKGTQADYGDGGSNWSPIHTISLVITNEMPWSGSHFHYPHTKRTRTSRSWHGGHPWYLGQCIRGEDKENKSDGKVRKWKALPIDQFN